MTKLADDRLDDRLLHEKPRPGAADVSLVEIDAVDDSFHGLIQRRIFEDDVRRFAAELEGQFLFRTCRRSLDALPYFG